MSSPEPFSEHAVVVGASGALGTAIVGALHDAGKHVVGIARSQASLSKLAHAYGETFQALDVDMATDDAIGHISAALSRPVAIVVHAPGVPVAGGIRAAPTSALVDACNIKVGGFIRLVRAVESRLRARSRLVAVGGHYGFEPTAYAATAGVANAALTNVVRQCSWAYGELGVTAHLVAPGPADTERLHNVAKARAEQAGQPVAEILAEMAGESAIGAFVEPEQVGWAIALLLDPRADAMAGSTLMLDAGRRRGLP